jgi:hypothetical protein
MPLPYSFAVSCELCLSKLKLARMPDCAAFKCSNVHRFSAAMALCGTVNSNTTSREPHIGQRKRVSSHKKGKARLVEGFLVTLRYPNAMLATHAAPVIASLAIPA